MNFSARVEKLDLKICVSFADKVVDTPAGVFERHSKCKIN